MPDAFTKRPANILVTNCSALIFKCKILRLSSQGDESDTVLGKKILTIKAIFFNVFQSEKFCIKLIRWTFTFKKKSQTLVVKKLVKSIWPFPLEV